ncbi:alpha/beta hydrolase [Thiotrichales bacterium 19S3-7]|nr:alpha/beta hydrolase [Thiotrichales bacterium 19S3-7]MCF6800729.1 alpha/beta hydrolase [Thiotrichales bacterium 19S3-11]
MNMQRLKDKATYLINGAVGQLEVAIDWPNEIKEDQTAVVICHPHPLYQGSMDNKVVTTISRSFNQLGLIAVRFNYRGVGQSEGTYGDGIGELEDLLAVIGWLRIQKKAQKIILAGFSFGGAIAYKAASRIDGVISLLMIAPSVIHFKLKAEKEPLAPLLVILSKDDEVVAAIDTLEWLSKDFNQPFTLISMAGAGHFFHGRLVDLKNEILNYYTLKLT